MPAALPRPGHTQVPASLLCVQKCLFNLDQTLCDVSFPRLLSDSWWGIRATSVTPKRLTARWARIGQWAFPKPTAWSSLRHLPRILQRKAQVDNKVAGRHCISRIMWRTSSPLLASSWRDRRNSRQRIPWRTAAPLNSLTRRPRRSRWPAAESEEDEDMPIQSLSHRTLIFKLLKMQNVPLRNLVYICDLSVYKSCKIKYCECKHASELSMQWRCLFSACVVSLAELRVFSFPCFVPPCLLFPSCISVPTVRLEERGGFAGAAMSEEAQVCNLHLWRMHKYANHGRMRTL